MRLLFKGLHGKADLHSNKYKFTKGEEYELTKSIAEYLLKTFGNDFEVVITKAASKPIATQPL